MYAYLRHGGALVPLSNPVGVTGEDAFGYADTGMIVTLTGHANTDLHSYGTLTSLGEYRPDGRTNNPLSAPGEIHLANRLSFDAFNSINPHGTWTLFIADMSSGAQSKLASWSLDITPVPEPVSVALAIFGGVFLVFIVARNRHVRDHLHRRRAAVVQWIDAV